MISFFIYECKCTIFTKNACSSPSESILFSVHPSWQPLGSIIEIFAKWPSTLPVKLVMVLEHPLEKTRLLLPIVSGYLMLGNICITWELHCQTAACTSKISFHDLLKVQFFIYLVSWILKWIQVQTLLLTGWR